MKHISPAAPPALVPPRIAAVLQREQTHREHSRASKNVALCVMSLPETTPPGGGGGTRKTRGAEPSGPRVPRRPHENFILRTAPCPVLTVRRVEHEFVEGLGVADPGPATAPDTERR